MIKNIIFDFGGVIIPVNPMAYAEKMITLGCSDMTGLHQRFQDEEVYIRFEKGELSPEEFRNLLRSGFINHISDEDLDRAWNQMLGEVPPHRVRFLEDLKVRHRTFLLSNTNIIHYHHYQDQFCATYGYASLDDLFEKAYYSYQLKMYKPDPAIFEFVLKDSGLIAVETLFIDDNPDNIRAAEKLGIKVINLADGMEVVDAVTLKLQSA
jgi:putative hydrolase of the HAD superfamily